MENFLKQFQLEKVSGKGREREKPERAGCRIHALGRLASGR
jgi:hypothetical protein